MKIERILAASGLLVLLCSSPVRAGNVAPGTDYLQTASQDVICAWPLPVPRNVCGFWTPYYYGPAIGPQQTNMTVEHPADIPIDASLSSLPTLTTGDANLMITGLSMQGTYNGNPVYLALDPSPSGTQDLGYMEVAGDLTGGTFISELDVYYDVCTAPSSTGVGCGTGTLLNTGELDWTMSSAASWSPTPPPGSVIVNGTAGDQSANLHSGLPGDQVDFFSATFQECNSGPSGGCTDVQTAETPEPTTLLFFGPALLGLAVAARKRLFR